MAERFSQGFVREVKHKGGKAFQGVLKYKEPNPSYKPKPEGEDTRKPSEKRAEIWRQTTTILRTFEDKDGREQPVKTKNQANRALHQWKDAMEAESENTHKDMPTTGEYVRKVIDRMTGIQASTAKSYRYSAKLISETFEDVPLCDLNADMLSKWLRELKEKRQLPVVRRTLVLFKLCCNEAVDEGLIQKTPFTRSVKLPKVTVNRETNNAMHEAERRRAVSLLRLVDTPKGIAANIALYTAMRRGEICALKWSDVQLEKDANDTPCGGMITVRHAIGVTDKLSEKPRTYLKPTKTEAERKIPVYKKLAEILSDRKRAMMKESIANGVEFSEEMFVIGGIDGKYYDPDRLSREWATYARDNKINGARNRPCVFHDLRRSWSTAADHVLPLTLNKAKDEIMGHVGRGIGERVYSDAEISDMVKVINSVGDNMQEPVLEPGERATDTEG